MRIQESRSKKCSKWSNLMKMHESRSKKRSKWSNLMKIHKNRSKKRSKWSNLVKIHESRSKKRSKWSNLMRIHESRSKKHSKCSLFNPGSGKNHCEPFFARAQKTENLKSSTGRERQSALSTASLQKRGRPREIRYQIRLRFAKQANQSAPRDNKKSPQKTLRTERQRQG
jgi:hypothetical protein